MLIVIERSVAINLMESVTTIIILADQTTIETHTKTLDSIALSEF